jgi:hypothetical protein
MTRTARRFTTAALAALFLPRLALAAEPAAPKSATPVFALAKDALRFGPSGPTSLPCVEGNVPRGTPVLLIDPESGRSCRTTAAEPNGPIVGGGECTSLDGPCPERFPIVAIVGATAMEIRPAHLESVGDDEAHRAVAAALKTLSSKKLDVSCSTDETLKVVPGRFSVTRAFGPGSGIILVHFEGLLSTGPVKNGAAVALSVNGAEVAWGPFASTPVAFYVNGKAYVWGTEGGLGCGARFDSIYAVEGNKLRRVHETGFMGD